MLRVLASRLLDLVLARRRDARLDEEMETHLALLTDELRSTGLSDEEARLAARRAFGGVDRTKMTCRDVRGLPVVDGLLQDARFAARILVADRRFTVAAAVALGLGIGAANTIFTLVNTAVLRDLPFDEPDRLVAVQVRDDSGRDGPASHADFLEWRTADTIFDGLAAVEGAAMNLGDADTAVERFRGAYLSANALAVLRVAPVMGRGFTPADEEPGAPPVVVIGYGIWQARYGADPAILGRVVRVNDAAATIVGVMPNGFSFPHIVDVWQPLARGRGLDEAANARRRLQVFGRLAADAELMQAQAALRLADARLTRDGREAHPGMGVHVVPLGDSRPDIPGPMLAGLVGTAAAVLFITCANVANLLLARALRRSREMALRASLGATRWRIVRQVLIECLLLATLAGAIGLGLSVCGVRLLGVAFNVLDAASPAQSTKPYWVDLSMNAPVYLFVGVVCLVTSLGVGLLPALHVSRTDPYDVLKEGGRTSTGGRRARRLTGAFLVIETALTLVLLATAGLLTRNFIALYRGAPVIDTKNLLTLRLALPESRYPTFDSQQRFYERLEERLAASPLAVSATLASEVPLAPPMNAGRRPLTIAGRPAPQGEDPPSVTTISVGRRYVETLALPITQGRTLTAADTRMGREGVLVNERFAALFFPGLDPIGQRIRLGAPTPPAGLPGTGTPVAPTALSPWLTIVGLTPVVTMTMARDRPADPAVYIPLRVDIVAPRTMALLVRGLDGGQAAAAGGLPALVSGVREEVRTMDPALALYAIETLDAVLTRNRFPNRLFGTWFGMLALVAVAVAAVGIYALTAHGVAERRQEVGIRAALGAGPVDLVWLFAARTAAHVGLGVALGTPATLAVAGLLPSINAIDPRDPLTLVLVTIILIVVSAAAGIIPAVRIACAEAVSLN